MSAERTEPEQVRILHVFRFFRPKFTGEGIFLERLAPHFGRARPDVIHDVLVTVTPEPKGGMTLPHLGEIHYLSKTESRDGASQSAIIGWMARHGRRYAVVHHHTHADRTLLGSWLMKLKGRRSVQSATLDDSVKGLLQTYRPLFRPLVRILFSAIDRFVAISPKLFSENNLFVPAGKSVLIPIGIVIPQLQAGDRALARRKLAIPDSALVLVSVGGLCARKDQMTLVKHMPDLVARWPDILLLLVGPPLEPDYCEAMEEFVARHGLKDHVRFAGYAETPWDYYKAADIMVFASREEGFGTVVIEAMAHRLPVVARRLPGVNDAFVAEGETGYLFERDEDYAARTGALLGDEALRRRMGSAGRAFVAAHYDIERVAARYLDVYGFPARP
jgi:glycosyltransferase involved in cell wall biosynthesis